MKTARFLPILLMAVILVWTGNLPGQVVPIKSLPLATGDQYAYVPSENSGMAGLSLAIDDAWADPFTRPARGVRVKEGWLYTAPYYYRIQNNLGRTRSLPVGLYFAGNRLFGGIAGSMQNFDPQQSPSAATTLSDRTATNLMGSGVIGYKVSDHLSIGAGVNYASLEAMDGVQMLYAWNDEVIQSGSVKQGRLNLLWERPNGHSLELTAVHQRSDMEHELHTREWWWGGSDTVTVRTELDKHRLWGGQLLYRIPLKKGWTLALSSVYNRKTHPKIPNYDIMRIPRDPGHSDAFQWGLGLARNIGPVTFALEAIVEPIASKTWTEAVADTHSVSGAAIRAGSKTVVNDFDFNNFWYRMGLKREEDRWGFQLGMEWRNIDYHLKQTDAIAETQRDQDEKWLEWTFTWGLRLKFPEFDLLYSGSLVTGGGLPGINMGWRTFEMDVMSNDYIVAPAGELSLQDANVMTHRVTCIIPF